MSREDERSLREWASSHSTCTNPLLQACQVKSLLEELDRVRHRLRVLEANISAPTMEELCRLADDGCPNHCEERCPKRNTFRKPPLERLEESDIKTSNPIYGRHRPRIEGES